MRHPTLDSCQLTGETSDVYWPGGRVEVVPIGADCPGIPGAVGTIGSRMGVPRGMTGTPVQHSPFGLITVAPVTASPDGSIAGVDEASTN